MNFSFPIGIILGIGGMVNLFIMFIDQEFSLIWFLFSLFLIVGSNVWLLTKTSFSSEEKKEIFWAKHGVWSVGLVVVLIGSFKHSKFATNFLISTLLLIALIVIQFIIYSYQLKKCA